MKICLRSRSTAAWVVALFFATTAAAHAEWAPTAVPADRPLSGRDTIWMRCFLRVPDNMTTPAEKDLWRDSVTLSMGGIAGPFSVWLNGQKIAEADAIAEGERRRFKVPKGILENKQFNVLAVRLQGNAARTGLTLPPILAGYFDEQAMAGTWEMLAGEPAPEDLRAVSAQPARAFFTETGFRLSSTPLAPTELMPGAKLSPAESLAKMTTRDDLAVDLVLSEPLVAQPTHLSFDERGRMWVAQYRQYPYPAGLKMISRDQYYRSRFDRVPPAPPHHDRGRDIISVHEDTDGDGVFDQHRVVLDGLNMANAVLRGHGGMWVMHTPYLLFYPGRRWRRCPRPRPGGAARGLRARGHALGRQRARVGPGRLALRRARQHHDEPRHPPGSRSAGLSRASTTKAAWSGATTRPNAIYEIFAEGGGNVFGLDFDAEGRLFSGHNGGDTRGFHYLQSGLFLKQGIDPGKFGPQGHPVSLLASST